MLFTADRQAGSTVALRADARTTPHTQPGAACLPDSAVMIDTPSKTMKGPAMTICRPIRLALMPLLFALLCCILSFTTTPAHAADQPNIIIFLVDDMGVMDTSVPFLTDKEGNAQRHPLNDFYRTPGMQRLADQGVRFNNFCAMSVCSPTRTSIITGQNATRHHVTQWIRSENNNRGEFGPPNWNWVGVQNPSTTLPGVLKTVGYRTIFIGKAHFGPLGQPSESPANLGFDVNIAGCSWGQPGSYYGQSGYGHLKGNKNRAVPHLEKYHGTDTFLSEALTLEAKDQISKAVKEDKPFFMDLAHYAVHAPFDADPRFAPHYANTDKNKNAQAFATLIEGMDKSLGDVLDHLETLGIAEDTLILFLGDNGSDAPLGEEHGYSSSAPLRGKKATHYEGGMRVPFIAAWAKPNPDNKWQKKLPIAQGTIQPQLGAVMDLYPTILALVDAKAPQDYIVDGVDLAPQFTGKPNPQREERFLMHFPHGHRSSYFTSLRLGDWKIIYHYEPKTPDQPGYELFNLKDDPFEKNDLSAKEPNKLKRMMNAMIEQLNKEDAQYPVDKAGNELKPKLPIP